jgi:signal transduction histidine kinase
MIEVDYSPAEMARHALPADLLHELRTPLNQIIGYSELLLEQAESAPERESPTAELVRDLQNMRVAGQRLQAIIEDNFYPIGAPGIRPLGGIPLPMAVENVCPTREAEVSLPTSLPVEARRPQYMLVVDDIEANRDLLSRRLEGLGYCVATAATGRQALDMLAEHPYDLVLLDIMMPEIDGFEVLATIKSDERLRHIPVIMISALSESESVARCIEMGAEDYLTKPFNPILLKARVGACLGKKLARDREMELLRGAQESYRELLKLEALRDDLTHMIIHDLRTPLTSVIAGLQTLDVVGELNSDQHEMLGIAVSGGESLVGIINDLLDIEKLESGSMPLVCSMQSPATLVADAVRYVASLAEAGQLMLLWDAQEDLPSVWLDQHKVRRVLVNLLGNAIKFTPAGGSVTATARVGEDEASMVFSVRDTGEGIPAEAFGKIFEKFGQVASRQGGQTNSTGLGLTFCKLAIEAHGGQIGVESTPGEGSNFWFSLPLPHW